MFCSRRLTLRLAAATLGLWAALPCAAYPIAPVTLWELVERAELIVVTDVIALEPLPEPESERLSRHPDKLARLEVREIWKGSAPAQLLVPHSTGRICPAPPRYVEGKTVVAFLAREGDEWFTVGLSYGTLYVPDAHLSVMRERVREALELQKRRRLEPRERVAWLVRTASHPATRWHGLYEILPESDTLHSYYDRGKSERGAVLDTHDLAQLAAAFVTQPAIDRTLPMMLAVLEPYPDPDVDRTALAGVEALLRLEHPPWWTREAIVRTLRRWGDPDPEPRLAPLGEFWLDVDPEALRQLWRNIRQELHLPDVEPAELNRTEVRAWGRIRRADDPMDLLAAAA